MNEGTHMSRMTEAELDSYLNASEVVILEDGVDEEKGRYEIVYQTSKNDRTVALGNTRRDALNSIVVWLRAQ